MFVGILMVSSEKKLHHRLDIALDVFVGIEQMPTMAFIDKNQFVYLAGVEIILCPFFSTVDKQFHRNNFK